MNSLVVKFLHLFHMAIRPLILAWYSVFESHRVRVVVKHGTDILFVKTSFSAQRFSLPGGGIEHRESALEAAARELHEETGILLPHERFHLVGQMRTARPAIPFLISVFEASVTSDLLPPLAPLRTIEIVDRQWLSASELPLENQVIDWYLKQG